MELTSIGVVSPTIDKCLQVLPIIHLRIVFFPKVAVSLRLGRVKLREVAEEQSYVSNKSAAAMQLTPCSSPIVLSAGG